MTDVLIAGGGLAGLVNAILLSRNGLSVMVVEKRKYPFHKVCGEYISNETLPFLEANDLFPVQANPPAIDQLFITSTSGGSFSAQLDLGGFGISRYTYDHWLAEKARGCGVSVLEETAVSDILFSDNAFSVKTHKGDTYHAKLVIGAQGKRSKMDKSLNRPFMGDRYPYVGVKYHVKADAAADTVALHNFDGGYCGLSKIEEEKFNLCYLIHRSQIKKHGGIEEVERNVLSQNPFLSDLFQNSEFLFDKPEVINEISFKKKEAVFDHIIMSGDSAGMITPLCGNGMAMAIRSASVLSRTILENWNQGNFDRELVERSYQRRWDTLFAKRLRIGRIIQSTLFGKAVTSELAILTGRYLKPVANSLIKLTHGKPF